MKNLKDLELKKELWARGYEVYEPELFAVETLWTLDDAIDAIADLNRNTLQMDNKLSHEVLMQILNDTLNSEPVQKFIYNKLKDNIQEYLES